MSSSSAAGTYFFVERARLFFNLKSAVAPHEFERRQDFPPPLFRADPAQNYRRCSRSIRQRRAARPDSSSTRQTCRMPSEPSGSMRHVSSSQNSFSSQTSPGFTSRVSLICSPSRSRAARKHRLAKAEPLRVVCLVGMYVVALRTVAHRQNVVGEVSRLVPRRRQRHVAADQLLIRQGLDPREAVGVRPDGIIDARKIDIELSATRPSESAAAETTSSFIASGYSCGHVSSFQLGGCGGV